MESSVRIATAEDEPEIIRLLHLMHEENGLVGLDIDCAREMFGRAFQKKGGIIGVIGPGSGIEAMIFLLLTRFWYRKENHLEELFNYVRPDHRRSSHARTLISFAKRCSDEIGVSLAIGVMTNKRVAEKVRLYRRSLGNPAGAFFLYNAKWANEASDDEFWKSPFPAHSGKKNGKQPIALPIK